MNIILFIINPFIGFLRSMRDLRDNTSAIVFILFYALFGFAISFTLTTADSYRVGAGFCQFNFTMPEVMYFFREGMIPDIYRYLMYGLVRPFTDNPKFMFAVFGTVIGIFSFLTLRQFYTEWDGEYNGVFYILIICAISVISFTNVNGVRFWTATSIFTYFAILFIYKKKKWAFIGIALTPFVHFSFYFAIVGSLLYYALNIVFRGRTQLFFLLTVVCFLVSIVMTRAMTSDLLSAEDLEIDNASINKKVEDYSATSTLDTTGLVQQSLYRRANTFYTIALTWVNKIGLFILLVLLYLKQGHLRLDNTDRGWFNFILLLYALSSIGGLMFSSGHRFFYVVGVLFLFLMLLIYKKNKTKEIRKLIYWTIPCFFYIISFNIVNAPRLVTTLLWYLPTPAIIMDGWNFGPIDYIM